MFRRLFTAEDYSISSINKDVDTGLNLSYNRLKFDQRQFFYSSFSFLLFNFGFRNRDQPAVHIYRFSVYSPDQAVGHSIEIFNIVTLSSKFNKSITFSATEVT